MKISHLFVFGTLFSLVPLVQAAQISKASDAELAQKFAPVFANEHAMIKDASGKLVPDRRYFDDLDFVTYDVAQTSSHIFISYQAMRAWSMDRELERYRMGGIARSEHPVDSEDVWEVIKKNEDGTLSLVFYATNAHGDRLVYGVDMDKTEQAAALKDAQGDEHFLSKIPYVNWLAGDLKITPQNAELATRTGGSPRIGTHPFVASGAGSHAINRAGFSPYTDLNLLETGDYTIAAPKSMRVPAKKGYSNYPMAPVSAVLAEMTFSPEALAMGKIKKAAGKLDDDKVTPCTSMTLNVAGASVATPPVPSHVDVVWYLTLTHPDLLAYLRTELADKKSAAAKYYPNTLSQPEADFYWTHEGPKGTKLPSCPRLDPAEAFSRLFPATYKAQGGTRDYTRYDLMNAKVHAYDGVAKPYDL